MGGSTDHAPCIHVGLSLCPFWGRSRQRADLNREHRHLIERVTKIWHFESVSAISRYIFCLEEGVLANRKSSALHSITARIRCRAYKDSEHNRGPLWDLAGILFKSGALQRTTRSDAALRLFGLPQLEFNNSVCLIRRARPTFRSHQPR